MSCIPVETTNLDQRRPIWRSRASRSKHVGVSVTIPLSSRSVGTVSTCLENLAAPSLHSVSLGFCCRSSVDITTLLTFLLSVPMFAPAR
uniref:Uncharacterized protein n=1 Tax=Hyaloperonospora arabidopsidis (strain Emoy2) TaxID=559515 RepID=M4C5X4_HYAAE